MCSAGTTGSSGHGECKAQPARDERQDVGPLRDLLVGSPTVKDALLTDLSNHLIGKRELGTSAGLDW